MGTGFKTVEHPKKGSPMKKFILYTFAVCLLLGSLALSGCGGGGTAGGGPPVAKAPAAPTGVTATGGINKVTLVWDPVPGADSYNIYWSTNPQVTTATGTKITGATSPYQHVGLLISETYFYIVTAVNADGESVASTQAATVVATDGANLYNNNCAGCHGPITSTTIMDGTPDRIKAAIAANTGGMGRLSTLTSDQIDIIAQQLPCH